MGRSSVLVRDGRRAAGGSARSEGVRDGGSSMLRSSWRTDRFPCFEIPQPSCSAKPLGHKNRELRGHEPEPTGRGSQLGVDMRRHPSSPAVHRSRFAGAVGGCYAPGVRRKVARAQVADELGPGAPLELLADLHLLTRAGDLNADARRKLKQIRHLVGLLRPALEDVLERHADPVIVDCGAGKSYLGFLLYALVLGPTGRGTIWSIETRDALVSAGRERAARFGFDRMRFVAGEIASAELPERVHVVTALHACDTATDDTLVRAIRSGADHVAVVPCCQAEVARQLADRPPEDAAVAALAHHPWHRREIGAHLTNVIRALALEAHGYLVTVTEVTAWAHTVKNELLLGRRVGRYDRKAEAQLAAVLERFGVRPAVVRGLEATPAARSGPEPPSGA